MTTDAAAATCSQRLRPWHEVAPSLDADPAGVSTLAAHWLAYAQAHWRAFSEAFQGSSEDIARASHAHLLPYLAAWTAAALAKNWTPARINAATADGETAAEFLWQWLTEAGIDPESIESAVDTVRRVEDNIAARKAESGQTAPDPQRGPAESAEVLNLDAVRAGLEFVLIEEDYDLHKAILSNEETGEDEYPQLVKRFAHAYRKALA